MIMNRMLLTIKVDCPGAVLVDLLNDAVQILIREFVVQLLQNLLQHLRRDVAVAWRSTGEQA